MLWLRLTCNFRVKKTVIINRINGSLSAAIFEAEVTKALSYLFDPQPQKIY